jgi:hypothetical protein
MVKLVPSPNRVGLLVSAVEFVRVVREIVKLFLLQAYSTCLYCGVRTSKSDGVLSCPSEVTPRPELAHQIPYHIYRLQGPRAVVITSSVWAIEGIEPCQCWTGRI